MALALYPNHARELLALLHWDANYHSSIHFLIYWTICLVLFHGLFSDLITHFFFLVYVKAIYTNHELSDSTTHLMTNFPLQHSHQVVIWTVLEQPEWLRTHRLQRRPISSFQSPGENNCLGLKYASLNFYPLTPAPLLGAIWNKYKPLNMFPLDIWITISILILYALFCWINILSAINYFLLLLLLNVLTNIVSGFFFLDVFKMIYMLHIQPIDKFHIFAIVLGGEGDRKKALLIMLILHEIWVPKIQPKILHS